MIAKRGVSGGDEQAVAGSFAPGEAPLFVRPFAERLSSGDFVVTADLLPPRGPEPVVLDAAVVVGLRRHGIAVNVADMPSAALAQAALGPAVALLQAGVEPILQITGRDRNRLALQADLLAAHALGVRVVLCLTGDHTRFGDHPGAKPVFDLSSSELLAVVAGMNEGRTLAGGPLDRPTSFLAGAAVNPSQQPLEPQLHRALAKGRAGAGFYQTQPIFSAEDAVAFLQAVAAVGLSAPVLVGTFLLESAAMARFMNEKVPGVVVPASVVAGLERSADPAGYGRGLARDLVEWARGAHAAGAVGGMSATAASSAPPRPAGVHVMSLNRRAAVLEVLGG
ncbi:MAG: methylenetetrahydrofolate reductase [Actinobacteria bacterium]|nr:methylenetetrahydrofolate reductase [Actinomycetota bacterium]